MLIIVMSALCLNVFLYKLNPLQMSKHYSAKVFATIVLRHFMNAWVYLYVFTLDMMNFLQDIQSWQPFFHELTHIEVSDTVEDFKDCYEAREASITAYMKDHPLSWRDITIAVYKCGEKAAFNSLFQMVSDEGKNYWMSGVNTSMLTLSAALCLCVSLS